MTEEIQQIFEKQLQILPPEVVAFLSSTEWAAVISEMGSLYNLSDDQFSSLKQEVSFVLAGLTHPDEFSLEVEREAGIHGAILDALVKNIEQKVFAPIRPALVDFFEKEAVENTEATVETAPVVKEPIVETPRPQVAHMADVAPDNLPTGEEESFLPNLAPKTSTPAGEPAHPFEEKMKRVFTAGQQSLGDLAIETTPPPAPKTTSAYQADPYREPIE